MQAIFNSNLVQASSSETSKLTVSKDIWVFIISSVALSFLTLLIVWILERCQKRELQNIAE
jgi:hypothetical protein